MVFAGPNGAGKTSVIEEIKHTGLATVHGVYPVPARFINPDQVAKDLKGDFANQDARDEAAQAAAVQARAEAIASKLPFAFETVMSHPSRINEMLMLKEQGYRLFLTFITTDDPEKNVARVKFRYETGTTTGHYVAPQKVRERYVRTLALLPRASEIADNVYIYDNSTDTENCLFSRPIRHCYRPVRDSRPANARSDASTKNAVLNQAATR
ncbi:MAG: zeta toxin family protein [Duganella sp.]